MGWLASARGVGAAPGEARLGQPRGRTGLFSSFHGRLADLPRPAEVRASAGPASDGTSDPRSLLTRSWQGATPCQPGGPSPQPTWGRAPLQGRHHRRPPRGARERGAVLPGSRVRAVGHDRGQPLGAGLLQERLPPLSAPGALRPGVSVRGACRRQPGPSPPGHPTRRSLATDPGKSRVAFRFLGRIMNTGAAGRLRSFLPSAPSFPALLSYAVPHPRIRVGEAPHLEALAARVRARLCLSAHPPDRLQRLILPSQGPIGSAP